MRLQDCSLDINLVAIHPVHRTEPEASWVEGRDSGTIPSSVFDLYSCASYLSFGTAPPFLADDDKTLFTYFGMLLESLKDSLVEANDELGLFVSVQNHRYDPGKEARGEQWDPLAEEQSGRHFKYLLLSLHSALDALADVVAIFFTGRISRLCVGRAQFSRIETWLEEPVVRSSSEVTPQEHFLQELRSALHPLVYPDSPERDWLRLMRLFRNKATHLGRTAFRYWVLHDKAGQFYTFLPRQWPYFWEKHLRPADPSGPAGLESSAALLQKVLIQQDMITYAQGLRMKVHDVIASGALVLNAAYEQLKDCSLNILALAELKRNSEAYSFECFGAEQSSDAG